MKYYRLFTVFVIYLLGTINVGFGQDIILSEPLKIVCIEKFTTEIKKDAELFIYGISSHNNGGITTAIINAKNTEGILVTFDSKKIDKFKFKELDSRGKIWEKNSIVNGMYTNLLIKGYQYDIRNELNDEAIEYINTLNSYDRFYQDEYFEDYLYTLLNKIHSGLLDDKRPGNIFLKIIKDPVPNAFTLPNGCIIISTGLLSTIQSEDELVGILSHEVAHFVLDHQVLNYNLTIDRKKKAEFWAAFSTVVAASADIYLATHNKDYIPGILTVSTAIGATVISEEVVQRLGIKYNHQQEIEADIAAKEILGILKYDKFGLSVALNRIKSYCVITGNYLALSGSGSHPSLDSRINMLGLPESVDSFTQSTYLKKASFINTYNARIELFDLSHHLAANELVNRNIDNGVATEADYIMKAIITRRLSNTKESNEEVIVLLNKAKALNINTPIGLNKEEAISLLRLDKRLEAKKALQLYLSHLIELKERNEIKEIKNSNFKLEQEIEWTKKMIFKIDAL